MELEFVLGPRVFDGDRKVGIPVLRSVLRECEEHRLEERALGSSPFDVDGLNVEAPHLQGKPVEELLIAASVADSGDVLIEECLAGAARPATFRIRNQ